MWTGLRSKSWDEFTGRGAPHLSFVFTVCDNAAKEVCPFWPGQPMTAHWGVPDPAAVKGTPEEIERAYSQAFAALDRRISLFLPGSFDSRYVRTAEGTRQHRKAVVSGCPLLAFAKDKLLKADMRKLREAIKDGSCTVSEWKPLSGLASQKLQAEGA